MKSNTSRTYSGVTTIKYKLNDVCHTPLTCNGVYHVDGVQYCSINWFV